MKRIIYLLPILTLLVGCKQDLDFALPAEKIGFSATETLNEVSVFNGHYDISLIKSGKGKTDAKVEIRLGSDSDIAAYNAANGTSCVAAAAGSFTMPDQTSFTFSATEYRKVAQITWEPAGFFNANKGKDAVIPVLISESSIDVDSLRTMILIRPYISQANFSLTSAADTLDLKQNDIKSLFPEGDELTKSKSEGSLDLVSGSAQVSINKVVPSQDITLNLIVDNTLIPTISAARGKEYVQAPNGFATIQNSVVIKAGELYGDFTYTLNFEALFAGNELKYFGKNILIPVVIGSASPVGVGIGNINVANISVTISESGIVIEPSSSPNEFWANMDGIDGSGDEWVLLDGAQYAMAEDPNIESDWYKRYSADKLIDGVFLYDPGQGGGMGLWFWTPNVFPIPFTIDLGQEYIFKGFRLVYSKTHQNNYRHIRVYTGRTYNESTKEADWKLAFEGTRTYAGGWLPWPSDNGSRESLYQDFTFRMPEDALPETDATLSFALTKGRYLKLELVEPQFPTESGDYQGGRGYLMEFYVNGWQL
jgi:hypothetical protein